MMHMSNEETDTVIRAMEGNQVAFESLVKRFARTVYAQSFAILHDREEAEDLVQECFVKAYTYRVSLSDPTRFPQWLLAIARNLARDRLRRRRPVDHDDGQTLRRQTDERLRSPLSAMIVVDDLGYADVELYPGQKGLVPGGGAIVGRAAVLGQAGDVDVARAGHAQRCRPLVHGRHRRLRIAPDMLGQV